jgi:hypothetical protein
MAADPEQTAQLRELHEEFAWKVNAAVAEGREDLIRRYCGEYVEQAVGLLTEQSAGACDQDDCAVCQRPGPAPPLRRGRWRGVLDATRTLRRRRRA